MLLQTSLSLMLCGVAGRLFLPCTVATSHIGLRRAAQRYETREEMIADLMPKSAIIAEVGVWKGDFAEFIVNATMPREMHLIDPWPPGEGILSGDQDGNNLLSYDADQLFQYVSSRFSTNSAVHIHRAFSQDILHTFSQGALDAVYVDGDHSEGGALRDLLLAVCAVKPGGWIFGHDYEFNGEKAPMDYAFGVKRAVHRMLRQTGFAIHALAYDGYVSFAIQRD